MRSYSQQRLSEFYGQEVANTAWAFATVNYRDEKVSAASGPLRTGTQILPVALSGLVNGSEWVGTGRVRECMGGFVLGTGRALAPCLWTTDQPMTTLHHDCRTPTNYNPKLPPDDELRSPSDDLMGRRASAYLIYLTDVSIFWFGLFASGAGLDLLFVS